MNAAQARDEANKVNSLKHKKDIEEIYSLIHAAVEAGEYFISVKTTFSDALRQVLRGEGFTTTEPNDSGYSTISW